LGPSPAGPRFRRTFKFKGVYPYGPSDHDRIRCQTVGSLSIADVADRSTVEQDTCLPHLVSTGDDAIDARIVEALASVSTGDNAIDARIVEALPSVSTGDNAIDARIVEALASVSTGDNAIDARIVEALASVSTGEYAVYASTLQVASTCKPQLSLTKLRSKLKITYKLNYMYSTFLK